MNASKDLGEADHGIHGGGLVVDTGPLVAAADRADKDHHACRALAEGDDGPLVTTCLVIAEAAYLIGRQLGRAAEAALYAWTCGSGGTDASVITLAERHGTTRIATLNHRHFRVVRPRHAAALELLP